MQKILNIIFFSFLGLGNLTAQVEFEPLDLYNNSRGYHMENPLQKGDTAYVFGDVVNVRSASNSNSEIIGKVNIGTPVIVQDEAEKDLINGINSPWYKVSYHKGNDHKTGYLWGGLLAAGMVQIDDVYLLLGSTKKVENPAEGISQNVYEIRAASEGELLASTTNEIDGYSSNTGTYTAIDGLGFEEFLGGIWLYTGGGACGVASYQWFVFWDGENLRPLPLISGVGDGGVFYEYTDYIFPDQVPQGMGSPESSSKIYVKYEFFEAGMVSEDEEYDDLASISKSIVRPLKEDDKGRFTLPKGMDSQN